MDGCHIIIHRSEDILTWTQKKKSFFFIWTTLKMRRGNLKTFFFFCVLNLTSSRHEWEWIIIKTLSFKFQSLQGHPVGWIRPFDWLDPWTTISVPMSNYLDSGCHNLNILIKKTNLFRHVRLDNPKQNYADITFLWILSHQNTKNKEALQ